MTKKTPTDVRPVLAVSSSELDDLRARLRKTRWATSLPVDAWEAGTDVDEVRRLVEYWADGYDWRRHEASINELPHRFADIDGTPVHYLRFDAEREGTLPLVLTNGWPSTFFEMIELAQRLSLPSRFGGGPQDAFTVIVPSLPGFTFSPQRPGGSLPTHELWHRLMHDELGFERYGAHGGDLGAGVTGRLGQAHPEAVVGIHLLSVDTTPRDNLTPEEQTYLEAIATWHAQEGAYNHQQRTRPLTLAQGLGDSPSGLLAWILEKYRAWSDCGGEISSRFSDDFLLTQASLYWFTDTISTSFRPYYESAQVSGAHPLRVEVPTAVAVFPGDLGAPPPRSWVERTYHLTRYTVMPRGGHFAPHEEPALLADDLTGFFGSVKE
ncbi:epoxide hydrolase family protein [Kineosporia sp. NBRC 101731]|uniref:epoxide hydrolase family protein n=1 Tax=Kineosporia sp. NBRC 101731 TaxID=3032199 RepID=UPI0024A56459|nr:epoxide hydrolase family protein [Kineosporia sp. NBRC 101731]GLY29022.1 hydrolase [Kineosporia sp. NBRC 101731]